MEVNPYLSWYQRDAYKGKGGKHNVLTQPISTKEWVACLPGCGDGVEAAAHDAGTTHGTTHGTPC